MNKNNIYCLVTGRSKQLHTDLSKLLARWQGLATLETIEDNFLIIKRQLMTKQVGALFTGAEDSETINKYKTLLRKYSIDTLLVHLGKTNQSLSRDLSGIESCQLSLTDQPCSSLFIKTLLHYCQLKQEFRYCKRMLLITAKRNQWLVQSAREPIAYILDDLHIQANAAYLSLFGIQSSTELKSIHIWDLIPEEGRSMFKKFIKKQQILDAQQSLLMTMKTLESEKIRVGIHVAPTVLNGTRCLQLWAHKIEDQLTREQHAEDESAEFSPWTRPLAPKIPAKQENRPGQTLKEVFDWSQEKKHFTAVQLKFIPLTDSSSASTRHYFVKLYIPEEKRLQANQQPLKPAIFWNYILINKLMSELRESSSKKNRYLLELAPESIADKAFIKSLFKSIKQLPYSHPHICFMIPHRMHMRFSKFSHNLNAALNKVNCSLGVSNFTPLKTEINHALKHKPGYLALSRKWVKGLDPKLKQAQLEQITSLLEAKGIEVILL